MFRSIALVPVAVSSAEGYKVVAPPCIRPGQGTMLADAYGALPTCRSKQTRVPCLVICLKQQRNQIPLPIRLVLFPATPVLPSSVHVLPCTTHDPVSPNGTCSRPWALYLTSRSSRPSRASPTPAARLRTTMPRLSIRLWTPARALACVMLIENSLPTDGTKRLSPAYCACV